MAMRSMPSSTPASSISHARLRRQSRPDSSESVSSRARPTASSPAAPKSSVEGNARLMEELLAFGAVGGGTGIHGMTSSSVPHWSMLVTTMSSSMRSTWRVPGRRPLPRATSRTG